MHLPALVLVMLLSFKQSFCLHKNRKTAVPKPDAAREYCNTETFRVQCIGANVAIMTWAFYGRMRLGRCVTIDVGYIGCHSDVLTLMDSKCSGKQECSVRIPDKGLDATQPCLKELRPFLEASYICVPVLIPTSSCDVIKYTNGSLTTGYLAPSAMLPGSAREHPHCGYEGAPWVLTARLGQRINLTLYDFSLDKPPQIYKHENFATAQSDGRSARVSSGEARVCHKYARVDEGSNMVPICGSDRRVQVAYVSEANRVSVTFIRHRVNDASKQRRFIFKYEVIGCADLKSPPHSVFKRNSHADGAVVQCRHTTRKWLISCVENQWVGSVGNCPSADKSRADKGKRKRPMQHAYTWTGSTLLIVVSCSLLVGLCVLCVGLVVYKRKNGGRRRRREPANREVMLLRPSVSRGDEAKEENYVKASCGVGAGTLACDLTKDTGTIGGGSGDHTAAGILCAGGGGTTAIHSSHYSVPRAHVWLPSMTSHRAFTVPQQPHLQRTPLTTFGHPRIVPSSDVTGGGCSAADDSAPLEDACVLQCTCGHGLLPTEAGVQSQHEQTGAPSSLTNQRTMLIASDQSNGCLIANDTDNAIL